MTNVIIYGYQYCQMSNYKKILKKNLYDFSRIRRRLEGELQIHHLRWIRPEYEKITRAQAHRRPTVGLGAFGMKQQKEGLRSDPSYCLYFVCGSGRREECPIYIFLFPIPFCTLFAVDYPFLAVTYNSSDE